MEMWTIEVDASAGYLDRVFLSWNARRMMDLGDLALFARIADLGSLSAAARGTGMPKSTVSRAVTRLEAEVGSPLVERSARGLRLTEAGRLLLPHAKCILAAAERAQDALDGFAASPKGTLRINAAITFAIGMIAPMLPSFFERHPDIRVVLDTENRIIDVAREAADIAIRVGRLADSNLLARKLRTVELWPCASPAYVSAHGEPASVACLGRHKLFGWVDGPSEWHFQSPLGQMQTIAVQAGVVIPEPIVLERLLVDGAGIGRLPDFLAARLVREGALVRLLPDYAPDVVDVHAVYPSERGLSPKVGLFIDALIQHLREL